jgi:hypothetical protein
MMQWGVWEVRRAVKLKGTQARAVLHNPHTQSSQALQCVHTPCPWVCCPAVAAWCAAIRFGLTHSARATSWPASLPHSTRLPSCPPLHSQAHSPHKKEMAPTKKAKALSTMKVTKGPIPLSSSKTARDWPQRKRSRRQDGRRGGEQQQQQQQYHRQQRHHYQYRSRPSRSAAITL